MTEEINNISQENSEWIRVGTYGDGVIFANGDERKIVTPGFDDFNYNINTPEPLTTSNDIE